MKLFRDFVSQILILLLKKYRIHLQVREGGVKWDVGQTGQQEEK